ncbi:hypothetical protein QN382_23120, partial [Pseudomonas sp. 10B1]|nr:hypothetical protein [Pseudomonas sp. 10B1]
DAEWIEIIQLTAMDGVKAYRQYHGMLDEVIITGMLWPTRQHWVAIPCKKMIIPVYAYEADQIVRVLQRWWLEHGTASADRGDKLRHWQLDWGGIRCKDGETMP